MYILISINFNYHLFIKLTIYNRISYFDEILRAKKIFNYLNIIKKVCEKIVYSVYVFMRLGSRIEEEKWIYNLIIDALINEIFHETISV